jgi:hypothetical protein
MLVDHPERVAELVEHDSPVLALGGRRPEPAVVHRRQRPRAAHRVGADRRPREADVAEADPDLGRPVADEVELQVRELLPLRGDVRDLLLDDGIAVEEADAEALPVLPQAQPLDRRTRGESTGKGNDANVVGPLAGGQLVAGLVRRLVAVATSPRLVAVATAGVNEADLEQLPGRVASPNS